MRFIRITRPAWFDRALCRHPAKPNPAPFFPSKGRTTGPAKDICARCPVRQPCLDMAVADPSLTGVWGGTSETERDLIRTRRRTA